MRKRKSTNKPVSVIVIISILIFSAFATAFFTNDTDSLLDMAGLRGEIVDGGKMQVNFIDVGQGDCTLITTADSVILIDAGEAGKAQTVINYLRNKNIDKIDCCIATHPHSDHIGALSKVFDAFKIVDVILPEIPESIIPTTTTYENFLESLSRNVENIIPAASGDVYKYGDLTVEILAPVNTYDDLNDMSVVSRVTYGNTSVMITGDAETDSENDMLKNVSFDFYADILKIGHHGSKTSSGEKWLQAVETKFAVISCGIDNDGPPHKQLLKRLEKLESEYYRTDLLGDITFESDGKSFVLLNEAE